MKRILLVILLSSFTDAIILTTSTSTCEYIAAVKRMICFSQNFADFPTFAPNSDINTLEIISCDVTSIPANAFINVTTLQEIKITDNIRLTSVDDQAFNGLTSLLKLELANMFEVTGTQMNVTATLSSLPNIIEFNINHLKIQPIKQLTSSVKKLTLENANVSQFEDNTFERSSSIESLLITGATLSGSLAWLRYLVNLKSLRLASAQLTQFTLPNDVDKLEELYLFRNEIRDLSALSFGGSISTLRILDLSHTKVSESTLNDNFNTLTALTTLTLNSCPLVTKIPSFIKHLTSLKTLNLGDTNIDQILPNSFPSNKGLQVLSMPQSLSLRSIHTEAFADHENLNLLTMTQTNLPAIKVFEAEKLATWKEIFSKLNNLSSLRVQKCDLEDSFWNYVETLTTKLQNIELSQNKFSMIKDFVFSKFPALKNVGLSSNNITTLTPQSTYGILPTTRFYLNGNKISTIDNCTFANINITLVRLNDNPFLCDCRLKWLREALKSDMFDPPKCGPGPHAGETLTSIPPDQFNCTGGTAISSCIVIPYTTPLPPAPEAVISIDTSAHELSIANGAQLSRWVTHYYVTYNEVGSSQSYDSKVYLITETTEPLSNIKDGSNYTVCVKLYKLTSSDMIVEVGSLPNDDLKQTECVLFAAVAVATANIGLIIGVVIAGVVVVGILIFLAIFCYRRRLNSMNSKYNKSEEGIYEEYVYPPSSDVYSKPPPSRPVSRRFVRASDISRAGTQSTVLSTAPSSRVDLAQSSISLAVQNTVNPRQRPNQDPRRFVSMGNLPTNSVISTKPGASMSMDELSRQSQFNNRPLKPRTPSTDTALANRALPDPHAEDYEYIEDREQYYEGDKYLDMKAADSRPSQYMSMSSANSLQDVIEEPSSPGANPTLDEEDNYAVDFNPPVPPRPPLQNGNVSRRSNVPSRESQQGLVNRASDDSGGYQNPGFHLSTANIGNF